MRGGSPFPLALALCVTSILGWWQTGAEGRDLMVPKEQATTEFEPTETPSLDVQQKGVPQSSSPGSRWRAVAKSSGIRLAAKLVVHAGSTAETHRAGHDGLHAGYAGCVHRVRGCPA